MDEILGSEFVKRNMMHFLEWLKHNQLLSSGHNKMLMRDLLGNLPTFSLTRIISLPWSKSRHLYLMARLLTSSVVSVLRRVI